MTPSSLSHAPLNILRKAGELLQGNDHEATVRTYAQLFVQAPNFADKLDFNFRLARSRHRQQRQQQTLSAAICATRCLSAAQDLVARLQAPVTIFFLRDAAVAEPAVTLPSIEILQANGDIRTALFDSVLNNPRDEIHLLDTDFAGLVWGLYYRLIWGAQIRISTVTPATEPDIDALRAAVAGLPHTQKGLLDCSWQHREALDRVFAGVGGVLGRGEGLADMPMEASTTQIFELLDGWEALRSPAAAPARTIPVPAPVPPEKTQAANLVRAARREVLSVEREVLGYLRKSAVAEDSLGEQRIRQLEDSVNNSVTVIKDRLTELRDSLAEPAAPSTQTEVLSQLDELIPLYPATPYYRRLRQVVADCDDAAALSQIETTLRLVDLRRQGQLPYQGGPLVSVVMPAFNREKLILDAIHSLLAQTYGSFELLVCDDASTDRTVENIKSFKDKRIRLIRQDKRQGAAAARNRCLEAARGEIIAYLDSDNIWHPRYLETTLEELQKWPGQLAAYAGFIDIHIRSSGKIHLRSANFHAFHLEDQIEKPFIDLNSFLHSRRLYEVLGGFDERLARRQDYDLISRYCWSREPVAVPYLLNVYQRFDDEEQITRSQRNNQEAPALIRSKIDTYYTDGLPAKLPPWLKKVSVLSWDMSRNHFAKAFCVAEALSKHVEVELISYRFFEEGVFQPLAEAKPDFETKYFEGGDFPDFFDNFARGVDAITGDAIYAVKPRLTSFGVGLLANYHTGKPLMLECNDLETVVGSAKANDAHTSHTLDAVFNVMDKAAVPHDVIWSQVLDPLVPQIPVTFTHNINLNIHYHNRSLYMRNIKDDRLYDPSRYDRDQIRRSLSFGPEDRVILFGGLVRKHKGIFELIELLERLKDPRYKLLVVGSRETPDLRKVSQQHGESVVILPPQPPERMAEINLAADLVVLWFDPNIPAGHYQSPYKMSDALAMGPSIISSPTSDLADFARRKLVWNVAFGDRDGLVAKIHEVFSDPAERLRRQERARAFFQREFSYKSVHPAFALGASGLERDRIYPAAKQFAEFFAEYEKRARRPGS